MVSPAAEQDVEEEMAETTVPDESLARRSVRFPGEKGGPDPSTLIMSNMETFYHKNGTTSVIAVPNKEPYRSNRRRYYLNKRDGEGQRIFFSKPQCPAPVPTFRCFIPVGTAKCNKGCYSLGDLYNHLRRTHPEESAGAYAEMVNAITKKLREEALDEETLKALGVVKEGAVATAESTEVPPLFWCRVGVCKRFFDSEQGRKMHESGPQSPHKKEHK
jgi:hypothetical protein